MRVRSIHVYPVKSARGVAPPVAVVGDRGFDGDRRWMVVDEAGRFLTQRELPRLALIAVAVEREGLRLAAPGMAPLAVATPSGGAHRAVEVWGDTVGALPAAAEASAWIARFLARPCALVYMPDASLREVDAEHGGGRVGFADGFPFLFATTASLDELARRGAPVPMDRFRPNLVVDGSDPFAEDGWRRVRVGRVVFRLVKPCARCPVTTVDQERGERAGAEPLHTLAHFRKQPGGVMFGVNAVHEGRGEIGVGDEVVRLE